MAKHLSPSKKLIAAMHYAALNALQAAPQGCLRNRDVLSAIEQNTTLDDWALVKYEGSGNTRWRSIFAFSSVGLVKGGYVTKAKGLWTITEVGISVITKPFDAESYLKEIDKRYREWKNLQIASTSDERTTLVIYEEEVDLEESPKDRMSRTLKSAHEALAAELVETIKKCDPEFFEKLVVKLLLKMGYGGSRQEAGRAVGRSGDGGIDGIINEDRLGLDAIYIQAKRWEGTVGEGQIRDFKGALDAKGAQKGVFITTSSYTPAALTAAKTSRSYKIVLIDGARLAELMIEHDLGVSVEDTYQLKRIDSDFFEED